MSWRDDHPWEALIEQIIAEDEAKDAERRKEGPLIRHSPTKSASSIYLQMAFRGCGNSAPPKRRGDHGASAWSRSTRRKTHRHAAGSGAGR
jgi:hypothetical protein